MNESEVPAAMNVEALELFFDQIIQGLQAQPNEVRRLFHGRGRTYPGLEQITCDWIGQHLLVQVFRPVTPAFLERLEEGLKSLPAEAQDAGILSIAIQHRYEQGAPTQLLFGEQPSRVEVVESGLKFYMNISSNQNSGLFLDMRCGRDWVKKNSQGKNVLNLFAYTCGFSVAALAGGATQVVNVDMASGALNRGRENHQLNDQDTRKVKFLAHDIFKSWGKIKRLGPYDLIISDPPSFQKGSFALTKDYQKILRRLPDLLADNGEVLACANSPAVTSQFVIEGMQEHAPELHYVKRLDNPEEFADVDSEANLKVQLFKKTSGTE